MKYTKASPVKDEHLSDAYEKWKTKGVSENSWIEPVESIVKRGYDLTAKNPNRVDDHEHRSPEDLVAGILAKEKRIAEILEGMQSMLRGKDGNR